MTHSATDRVAPEILELPAQGLNLPAGTLGDQLHDPSTLLVFLRHLG